MHRLRSLARHLVVPLLAGSLLAGLLAAGALVAAAPAARGPLPSQRQWLADVRQAMHGSIAYLDRRTEGRGRLLAVNLDIDNTALATHYDRGRAVRPVLRFARHAHTLGVRLLFNTARHRGAGRLARLRRELAAVGYAVTSVCGRGPHQTIVGGKQRCRRRFHDRGYTLIANIGNRRTDFTGGGYERAFRLPSYGDRLG